MLASIIYNYGKFCDDFKSTLKLGAYVTTDLLGRDARDICADFQFSEDGTRILLCPAGNQPKSSSIVKSTGKVRASFPKNKCENCPYKNQCKPKTSK